MGQACCTSTGKGFSYMGDTFGMNYVEPEMFQPIDYRVLSKVKSDEAVEIKYICVGDRDSGMKEFERKYKKLKKYCGKNMTTIGQVIDRQDWSDDQGYGASKRSVNW